MIHAWVEARINCGRGHEHSGSTATQAGCRPERGGMAIPPVHLTMEGSAIWSTDEA